MGRPKKGMSSRERQALDAAILALKSGTFTYAEHRLGMGVLRELSPEFADQLKPQRGQPRANDQLQRVLAHYTILNSPRYKEEPTSTRGPMPPQEIVKRIAKTEGITCKHVRFLLADEFAALTAKKTEEEKYKHLLEDKRRHELSKLQDDIRLSYEITVKQLFDLREIRSMAAFSGTFETNHCNAITAVAKRFAVDTERVAAIVQETKTLLSKKLEKEAVEILRYR